MTDLTATDYAMALFIVASVFLVLAAGLVW
jgi:hypothetical protein